MLVLSEREVAALLPMPQVIALMEDAFRAQSQGRVTLPPRTLARNASGLLGSMPGSIAASNSNAQSAMLGAKLVTVFARNVERGMPSHQALIALFDPDNGELSALIDGRYITEARTAATSALATRLLARSESSVLAVLGTGVQARAHIEAMRHVMAIRELRIWGRTPSHADELAAHARTFDLPVAVSGSVHDATRGAHVICTVTSTQEPLLFARDVNEGTHINAVGFASTSARELASDLVRHARIIVDSVPSVLSEAGDITLAIAEGALPKTPALIPLSDVVAGTQPGRRSAQEITIFESVGIALEDLVCGAFVCARAREQGIGRSVEI